MAKLEMPTVRDLYDSFITDYESRTGALTGLLRSAFVRSFGWVFAGLTVLCYRYGRWIYLQMFITTCSIDALRQYGYRVGIDQKDGSTSVVTLRLQGVSAITVAAGTSFVNPVTGLVYKTTVETPVLSGIADCIITSSVQGNIGILNIGDVLTLGSPRLGLPDSGTVTDVTTEGADAETDATYRQRVQARYRMKAQGGSFEDYWLWATEVDGIRDAFPYVINGGVVTVFAVADGSGADRLPTTEKLQEVEAAIRQSPDSLVYDRQPVQSHLNVLAPIFIPVTVAITGLTINALTAQNKADVKEAIINYLDSRRPQIPALNYPAVDATLSVLAMSAVASDIFTNADFPGTFDAIAVTVSGGAVTSKYVLPVGTLANLTLLTINGVIA